MIVRMVPSIRYTQSKARNAQNPLLQSNGKKRALFLTFTTLLIIITNMAHGMNPFAMPAKNPFKPFASPSGIRLKSTSPTSAAAAPSAFTHAIGETPLENEVFAIGRELEHIANELSKIAESKEIKQEIDKKRAARDKKSPQAGKAGFGGGYRPGSYKPSSSYGGGGGFGGKSFGGSSPFARSGGASFGKPSSPFGGFGGFGGSSGGFGSASKPSSDTAKFGSSPTFRGSTDSNSLGSSTETDTKTSKAPRFYGASNDKDKRSDEEATRAKATGNMERYIEVLEKELHQIAATQDKQVREKRILNLPLAELNKLFDEAFSTQRTMKKGEQEELEKSEPWKKHADKLKTLQSRVAPILIDLMIPTTVANLSKIDEARKTFEQLDIGSKVSQATLQELVATRCTAVAAAFKARGKGKTKDDKKPLVEELEKIIAEFPADKFGSPTPPVLAAALKELRK